MTEGFVETAKAYGWLARIGIYFLLSPVFAVIILAAMSILWVFSWVPLPAFQETIGRLQRGVASTVGDSFILRASPIEAAAIVSQVRRDLVWVARDCRQVAVVAHSQGAAIADLTLRGDLPADFLQKRVQLITFGSGLRKLEELRHMAESGKKLGAATLIGAVLALAGLNLTGILPVKPLLADARAVGWGGLFVGFLLWVGDMAASARGIQFRAEEFRPSRRFGRRLQWYDYYASSDPVSNGPLFDPDLTPDYLEDRTHEVHNRCSNLTDHTTYWENAEQFIAGVACAVGELVGINFRKLRDDDPVRIRVAGARRAWRVEWLGRARTMTLLGTVVLVSALWLGGRLASVGDLLLHTTSQTMANVWLLVETSAALELLRGRSVFPGLTAGLTGVFAGLLAYSLLFAWWRSWNRREIDAFFRREDSRLGGPPMLCFLISAFVVLDAAILTGAGVVPLPGEVPRKELFNLILYLAAPGAAGMVWFMGRALLAGKPTGFLVAHPSDGAKVDEEVRREGIIGGLLTALVAAPFLGPLLLWTPLFDEQVHPVGFWGWVVLSAAGVAPVAVIQWLAPQVEKKVIERSAAGGPRIALATLLKETDPARAVRILAREGERLLEEREQFLKSRPSSKRKTRARELEHALRRLVTTSMHFAEDLEETNPTLAAEALRVHAEVADLRTAYLDVETDYVGPYQPADQRLFKDFRNHKLTVVGIRIVEGDADSFVQLVGEDITRDRLLAELAGVGRIVTYNGRTAYDEKGRTGFDLHVIAAQLGVTLDTKFAHTDLVPICWKKGLYGGLKKVEVALGLQRKLPGRDGLWANQMWREYQRTRDKRLLDELLVYNKEDVFMLREVELALKKR